MRKIRRLHAIVAAAAAVVGVITPVDAADPLTDPLYYFVGTVTDPIGRPVLSATVADGRGGAATTGIDGTYRLGERDFNRSFRLTASRNGMLSASKDVYVAAPVDTRVDFRLSYRSSGWLHRPTLSVANGATTTILNVDTFAPNPGLPGAVDGASCVTVTDSRTGTTTDATFASLNADGSARWTWALDVPAGTTEGARSLVARVATCAGGTSLGNDVSVTYIVDNTQPTIADLSPGDGFNTALASGQIVAATVKDSGGAGVDPASIRFTVVDSTTEEARVFTNVSYNATTGRAQVGPIALAARHRHRVEVEATDRAGNTISFGHRPTAETGGAYATSVTTGPVEVRLPAPITCSLGAPDVTKGRTATCRNVDISLSGTTVRLAGTAHAGVGFVDVLAPLHHAQIVAYANGVEVGRTNAYAAGTTHYAPLRFEVDAATDADVDATAPGRTVRVKDPDPKQVSAFADSAVLVLGTVSVATSVNVCATPNAVAGAVKCHADPLNTRLVVIANDPAQAATIAADHEAQYGFTAEVEDGRYYAHVANGLVAGIKSDSRVKQVARAMEYDYVVSGAQFTRFDVTNTPAGQAAIAGMDDGGVPLRVYNMTQAAGLPDDGTKPDLFVTQSTIIPESVGVQVVDTSGRDLVLPNPALGGTSTSKPNGQGRWEQGKFNMCYQKYEDDFAYIQPCARIDWLNGDPSSTRDAYAITAKGTGGSYSNFRRTYDIHIGTEAVTNDFQWGGCCDSWHPDGDVPAQQCPWNIGLQVKMFDVVDVGFSYTFCENIFVRLGRAGEVRAQWGGGNIGKGSSRSVGVMAAVTTGGRGASWNVRYGFRHY